MHGTSNSNTEGCWNWNCSSLLEGGVGAGAITEGTTTATAPAIAGANTLTITKAMSAGDTIVAGGRTITAYKDAAALLASGDTNGIDITKDNDATKQATAITTMFAADADLTVGNVAGAVTFTQKVSGTGNVAIGTAVRPGAGVGGALEVKGTNTLTITTAMSAGDKITAGGKTFTAYKDAAAIAASNGGNGDANGIDITANNDATKQAAAIAGKFVGDADLTVSSAAGAVTFTQKAGGTGDVTVGTATKGVETKGSTTFSITKAFAGGETMAIGGKTITAYKDAAARTKSGNGAYGILATDNAATQATAIAAMDFGKDVTATSNGAGEVKLIQKVAGTGTVTAPVVTGAPGAAVSGEYNFDATAQKAGDIVTIDGQALTFKTGGDATQSAAELKTLIAGNTTLNSKYDATGVNANVVLTQKVGSESTAAPIVTKGDTSKGFSATLQIGANNGQSFTVNIADMRSTALGISSTVIGIANGIKADGTVDNAGASYTDAAVVTDGTTANTTEYSLDIKTNSKATKAIQVLDDAINRVSAERVKAWCFSKQIRAYNS